MLLCCHPFSWYVVQVRCNALNGQVLHVLRGHSGGVHCVAATQLNDGKSSLVLSAAADRAVHVRVYLSAVCLSIDFVCSLVCCSWLSFFGLSVDFVCSLVCVY